MAPPILQIDPAQKTLILGAATAALSGPWGDLLLEALLTMLPAEKMAMMAPATTRGYTLTSISQADYDQLSQTVAQINHQLAVEVLRTNFRARGPEEPLQAKILLGEKSVVRSVALV